MNAAVPTPPPQPDALEAGGFILRLAKAMHNYGYPAHQLEEVLSDVARRLGLQAQFFSTPTSIMAAFGELETQRTHLIRVEPGEVDLGKLTDVSQVVEDVVQGRLAPSVGSSQIDAIVAAPPPYGVPATVLAFGLASAAAARFIGGGLREILVAGGIGLILGLLGVLGARWPSLGRVYVPVAAFVAATLAAAMALVIPQYSVYVGTLAGLIVLIPGLTLTTAMTELSTGNLVSGTARLMGALILFLIIGFGVAMGGETVRILFGKYSGLVHPLALPEWTSWAALVVAPLAFTVLFRAHARDAGWILVAGGLGIIGSRIGAAELGPELGAFVGAFSLGVASDLYAWFLRRPASVTLVPGTLLLVPGSIGFRSLSSLLDREVVTGVETAFTMVLIAAGLVAGLLLANVVTPLRRPR
jgi:uncharacterized membrane protein YjjP (DUF1212 family)